MVQSAAWATSAPAANTHATIIFLMLFILHVFFEWFTDILFLADIETAASKTLGGIFRGYIEIGAQIAL